MQPIIREGKIHLNLPLKFGQRSSSAHIGITKSILQSVSYTLHIFYIILLVLQEANIDIYSFDLEDLSLVKYCA